MIKLYLIIGLFLSHLEVMHAVGVQVVTKDVNHTPVLGGQSTQVEIKPSEVVLLVAEVVCRN